MRILQACSRYVGFESHTMPTPLRGHMACTGAADLRRCLTKQSAGIDRRNPLARIHARGMAGNVSALPTRSGHIAGTDFVILTRIKFLICPALRQNVGMRLFFLILLTALSASGQRSRAGDAPVPFQRPPVETSGCPAEGTTGLLPRSGPGDFVELQRTSCFGSCPVYTVQIRADGEITWRGEHWRSGKAGIRLFQHCAGMAASTRYRD